MTMSWLHSLHSVGSHRLKSGGSVTAAYTLTGPADPGDALAIACSAGYAVSPPGPVSIPANAVGGSFIVSVNGPPGLVRVTAALNGEVHGMTVEIIQ